MQNRSFQFAEFRKKQQMFVGIYRNTVSQSCDCASDISRQVVNTVDGLFKLSSK